ncbi:hypothetical protein [Pseudomonas abietaniphila]
MSADADLKHAETRGGGKQCRGKRLEEKLGILLAEWFREVTDSGAIWVYTQVAFAKYAGVSRETVRSKQAGLDGLISELHASRRLSNGSMGLKHAIGTIERLKAENNELKSQIYALRIQHVRIFQRLYKKVPNLSVLAEGEFPLDTVGQCPLCGKLNLQ